MLPVKIMQHSPPTTTTTTIVFSELGENKQLFVGSESWWRLWQPPPSEFLQLRSSGTHQGDWPALWLPVPHIYYLCIRVCSQLADLSCRCIFFLFFFFFQILIHVFPKVQHFCKWQKWQSVSGWETSFLLSLLLVFWHVGTFFNGKLAWNECPWLSFWALPIESVFWNPTARASL